MEIVFKKCPKCKKRVGMVKCVLNPSKERVEFCPMCDYRKKIPLKKVG